MENKGVFWSSRICHLNKTLPYIKNFKGLCVWFNSRLTSFSCTLSFSSKERSPYSYTYILAFQLIHCANGKEIHSFNPLREVVNNFQESGDRSKNSTIFFICSKRPLYWTVFKNNIPKLQRVFILAKIRKFEIGQNVPNLHNFYWAFSALSQRSYKTTKNYLGFIFL